MRKMNDCVIAMEMFEKSYLDSYENCEKEHKEKQNSISLFKKISVLTADNYPSSESLPFIREASLQLSADSSDIAKKMKECIEMYRTAPTLLIDVKAIVDSVNAHTRFLFKNQGVSPPPKTDPNRKIIDIDFKKIKNAITADGLSLKKRIGTNGINGPDPKRMRVNNPGGFIYTPQVPTTTVTNVQRINDKTTVSIRGPVSSEPPRNYSTAAINQFAQNARPINTPMIDPRSYIRAIPTTRPMPVPNNSHIRQIRPNPPTMTIPMRNRPIAPLPAPTTLAQRMMQPHQPLIRMAQSNGHSVSKPPIVCDVKAGNSELEKQLKDVLKGTSSNNTSNHQAKVGMPVIGGPKTTTNAQPQPPPPQPVPPTTPAVTPTLGDSSPSAAGLPPIKLTLKRNNIQLAASNSVDQAEPKVDDWDDYCFVCNQGCDEISGELVCCETCPKVYHNICHCPKIPGDVKNLPDDWKCTRCIPAEPILGIVDVFTIKERFVCAKVLLRCYERSEHVEPFHNPIPSNTKKYFEIIKQPMCLKEIGSKVSTYRYSNVLQFIEDMNLVFKNCSIFNKVCVCMTIFNSTKDFIFRRVHLLKNLTK